MTEREQIIDRLWKMRVYDPSSRNSYNHLDIAVSYEEKMQRMPKRSEAYTLCEKIMRHHLEIAELLERLEQ